VPGAVVGVEGADHPCGPPIFSTVRIALGDRIGFAYAFSCARAYQDLMSPSRITSNSPPLRIPQPQRAGSLAFSTFVRRRTTPGSMCQGWFGELSKHPGSDTHSQ